MSNLEPLLADGNVRCHLPASSRKRALQQVAELIADAGESTDTALSSDTIFDGLMNRERLGSTGLGHGVAVPHCRIQAAQMRAAFVTLPEPIDYEASDGGLVDLIFVLAVPEQEQHAHLQALAVLAAIFSDPENRSALRACSSDQELYSTFCKQLAQQVPDAKSA